MTSNVLQERRYQFGLYPTSEQAAQLREQRGMMADLWNAYLQRREEIDRRTVQRQVWRDADGKRHVGISLHSATERPEPSWDSICYADGELIVVPPNKHGRPRSYTFYHMTNEFTWLRHELPEWAALSVWCGHRVARALDHAFEAFFRRAKAGAGAQSGYPKRRLGMSVLHRCVSGCKLVSIEPRGRTQDWRLTLQGVTGPIRARGRLPAEPTQFTDADVHLDNGHWLLSIAVKLPARRAAGRRPVRVHLDCIDALARVDGIPEMPDELIAAQLLQDDVDRLKAERDKRWPRRSADDPEWHDATARIARLLARVAAKRRNALHVWSARIVARASALVIIAPAVREHTASARGDKREWGANVADVADVNRHVLSLAPAMARAMLEYKAREAGIGCEVTPDPMPPIAISGKLAQAGKRIREAGRKIRTQTDVEGNHPDTSS